MSTASVDYDFIVVGGGSSGCIVASELATDGHHVLLLEAGDRAEDHPEVLRADGYKEAFINERLFHTRYSTKQGALGRRIYLGSGRGMGGSGGVNAMVYTRGDRRDFDGWGVPGWSWNDNQAAFAAVEAKLRPKPLPPTPLTEACIAAAQSAGFARSESLNDGELGGVLGYEAMNHEAGQRRNAYVAFMKERTFTTLMARPRCRVTRVIMDGTRATGVEFVDEIGARQALRCRREVILCAGALESPRLLLLSGIGPREELARHGIACQVENENVGANLQDHPNVSLFFAGREPTDYSFPQLYGFHRANAATALAAGQSDSCYVFYSARSSFKEGVQKLLPAILLPIFLAQIGVVRAFMQLLVRAAFQLPFLKQLVARMWGIVVILGKPRSRGRLRLASADPSTPAQIDAAYLTDPEDRITLRLAVRRALAVASQPALAAWGNRPVSGAARRQAQGALVPDGPSDAQIDAFIDQNVITTYHYAGTCRMGNDDASVVDPSLRVRGTVGLRVADASIVPLVPVSAMNAPSMMIGWRAAAAIKHELLAVPVAARG